MLQERARSDTGQRIAHVGLDPGRVRKVVQIKLGPDLSQFLHVADGTEHQIWLRVEFARLLRGDREGRVDALKRLMDGRKVETGDDVDVAVFNLRHDVLR